MSRSRPTPSRILSGRRERELLALPSVQHMAGLLSVRCREPSWVRTLVASLERFRLLTGRPDLERLLEQARQDTAVAQAALLQLAHALSSYTDSQIASLAMGPKVWFRLNGVPVPWRPLPGRASPSLAGIVGDANQVNRAVLLALIGSGLHRSELLRLRIGDVGSLGPDAWLIPDFEAEPLAIQYTAQRGRRGDHITFLTFAARQALRQYVAGRQAGGHELDEKAPLIARRDGSRATDASVARATQLSSTLINTVSNMNLELCMATGSFFRTWGRPGSRFEGPEEFTMEDFT